jgi:AsmA protein
MRKVALVIGVVILLVIVAAGIFVATFNPNSYKPAIQSKLEEQLNRKVQLGDMSLGLFPPRFRVANLSIAEDPGFNSSQPFVQTGELSISVQLMPLLHKSVQVDSLTLAQPHVELIKNAQGVWNFASLGQKTSSAPSSSSSSDQQAFALGKLAIDDGQVAITDLQAKKPRTVYDHINFDLTDFAPNKPFNIDASVHLPGTGNQQVQLQGTGGPLAHDNPAATPFKGALDLKDVDIAGLQKFLQTSALENTEGILSGHTNIANQDGKVSASGQLNMDKPKLHGIDVGYPINLDYDVNDDLKNDLLTINKGAIKLGPTPLFVTGTVNSKPTPVQLDVNLKASDVSIVEIARLAAAAGMAFSADTKVDGKVNANIQAKGPADKPVLNGTLGGRDIQVSGKDIAKPVEVKAINIALTPTEIRSDKFNVTSGGTTASTQFTLKQYASKSPLVDATVQAPKAALPDLLSMAKAYGVTGLEKLSGAGILNLDMHASGPLQAISSDQIMKALNGTLNVDFNNVRYAGVDISHKLAALTGNLQQGQEDKGFTNILKLTGNILVKNGIAQTNNLQAALDIANVGAVGTADLASQALNMQVNAVFSKDFSKQVGGANVGGTNIGGVLNTALSNSEGQITIPAIVTGTLQNPKFTPDTKKIAQMQVKGNASSLIQGLLGGKKQQNNMQNPQQPNQQQNAVDQIIGIFGKKKPK